MKTITENRIKNIPGFRRAPEHDFTDDGSHFIGFEYKGLPLTQHRSSQYGTYLCFRVDYISSQYNFTFNDYLDTEWYKLCNKYNGVDELPEIEEIVKDLEIVLTGIKELSKKVNEEVIDTSIIVERAKFEQKIAEEAVANFKAKFEWWNCKSDWDLKKARDYINSLQNDITYLKNLVANIDVQPRKNIRRTYQSVVKGSYIKIDEDDYYIKELNEILAKQENVA